MFIDLLNEYLELKKCMNSEGYGEHLSPKSLDLISSRLSRLADKIDRIVEKTESEK